MSAGSTSPALTSETCDDCGCKLYKVGADRDLFCPRCSEKQPNAGK